MFYLLLLLLLLFNFLFFPFLHYLNLIKCYKPEIFKNIYNTFKSCHCIWFCTLMLHFGTRAYLFSFDEGSCYVFTTRNNCCEFLASFQSVFFSKCENFLFFKVYIKSFIKTPVFGAPLSYPYSMVHILTIHYSWVVL